MNTDHIVLSSTTGAFECRHCGDTYKPATPCSLTMWIAMSDTFISEHRHCPAPAIATALPIAVVLDEEMGLPIFLRQQAD